MKRFSSTTVKCLTFFALALSAFPACSPSNSSDSKTDSTWRASHHPDINDPIADFSFTERSGQTMRKSDLLGKVWIGSFVFTRCTGPCPQVTATMARLQEEFAKEPDVQLVTFTVDPGRDNPAELSKYAQHFRADPKRWWFLTGKEEEIHHLLQDSFKIGVKRNPKATEAGQEFDHSTRLVLVDRKGRLRGYYRGIADPETHGTDPALETDLKRLKERVQELLATDDKGTK